MRIETMPFTVFDVETTGLYARHTDRIVEIAGVRIEHGVSNTAKTFSSFVNPGCELSMEAMRINKISPKDIAEAPAIEDVLPAFLRFAEGSILVAHNAEFDCGFLHAEKETCWGYIEIPECVCTRNLSRTVLPRSSSHDLASVAKTLGIPHDEKVLHRALPDVLLTAQVFLVLLERGKVTTVEELRKRAGVGVEKVMSY